MQDRLLKLLLVLAHLPLLGGLFLRLACQITGPYKARRKLIHLSGRSFISPYADIRCPDLRLGPRVFIDDDVTLFSHRDGGGIAIADDSSVQRYTIIETIQGGEVTIGERSHIQSGCNLTAALGSIRIGHDVQMAPRCALYPYQHNFADAETLIARQPIRSKGDIVIEDDAWLGVGVIIMDGVTIGRGAVVGAGAVVLDSIPSYAIAVGAPARIVGYRGEDRQ